MVPPKSEFKPFPATIRSPSDFFDWLSANAPQCGDFILITHDEIAALAAAWNTKEENSNGENS